MEEILHQLIGSLSRYLQGFVHPRWCRISSINSSSTTKCCLDFYASGFMGHSHDLPLVDQFMNLAFLGPMAPVRRRWGVDWAGSWGFPVGCLKMGVWQRNARDPEVSWGQIAWCFFFEFFLGDGWYDHYKKREGWLNWKEGEICFFIISTIFQANESGHITRKLGLEHSLGARCQLAWRAYHTCI